MGVVYEGLPHPVLAEKLYQREATRPDLISIRG
jgi:hypothetical protein